MSDYDEAYLAECKRLADNVDDLLEYLKERQDSKPKLLAVTDIIETADSQVPEWKKRYDAIVHSEDRRGNIWVSRSKKPKKKSLQDLKDEQISQQNLKLANEKAKQYSVSKKEERAREKRLQNIRAISRKWTVGNSDGDAGFANRYALHCDIPEQEWGVDDRDMKAFTHFPWLHNRKKGDINV
jgi:hypothetical protein